MKSWHDEEVEYIAEEPEREPVMLTLAERRLLAGIVRYKYRKVRKQLERSTYVPEDGKSHMDEVNCDRYWDLYHLLTEDMEPNPHHADMYNADE